VSFLYRKTLFRPEMVAVLIRPKVVHKLPRVLSPAEVSRLLAAVRHPKYRTLFALLYDTGLRITEAANLKVGDLDRPRGVIHVRGGKGGKDRQAKLGDRLFGILRTYWREVRVNEPQGQPFTRESYLFANQAGGPLNVQSAQRVIKLAARECGLAAGVTPHALRHSFATAQMEAGTSLPVLQAQMGHRDICTPQAPPPTPPPTWGEALLAVTGLDVTHCAACGTQLERRLIPPLRPFLRRPRLAPSRSPP
jgi:site-specific recombinase XerD